jgi:hypothetical protein
MRAQTITIVDRFEKDIIDIHIAPLALHVSHSKRIVPALISMCCYYWLIWKLWTSVPEDGATNTLREEKCV